MDVVDLPLEQIIPYARNPRRNEQAIATVAASIQEFGWRQPIVVDEAMVVLAGHTRLEAARKLGFKTAPVHVAKGLTASQARAFRIMDNRSGENAEWDKDLLNLELADLLEADFDLGLTGFTEDEVNALMSSLDAGTGPQEGEDEILETPEKPISRPGDLWVLGNHRLLCGDSTVATDVERLLGPVKPLLMVTDPPYGVEYAPGWRNQAGAAKTKRTGKVLNDDRADWREAWALFPGDVAYVWHGALHAATVAESLEVAGFTIRSQIIWAKERLVFEPGRLSLAARARLVRGAQVRQGPLGGRPQADYALAHFGQGPGRKDRPRHPEARGMHAPADPQQFEPGSGYLRALHGIGHHADRGRDHGPRLPRHRAEPGLCRCGRPALAEIHRATGRPRRGWNALRRPQDQRPLRDG